MNPPKQLHYDLFVREKNARTYWKLRDAGVTLDADGLSWNAGGTERRYRYEELRSLRLLVTVGGRSGNVYLCVLQFRDGVVVTVFSGDASGFGDEQRRAVYAEFVRVLHARLATLKLEHIDFSAGQSKGRYRIALFAGVLLICMFVVLPLGLLIFFRELEALFVLIAGAGFSWAMWRIVQSSRPRSYSAEYLPDDLVP